MGRLLNKEVYKAAYPLHDGEYSYSEFAKDDPRRTSNIRQVRVIFMNMIFSISNYFIKYSAPLILIYFSYNDSFFTKSGRH